MGILEDLTMDVGYLKVGMQGPTGSGKTTTAALLAIGLHQYAKMTGPVAFYDTERGSGFVRELFDRAGIKLVGTRSRSFSDLESFLQESEKNKIQIAIIDSITHPWRDVIETFMDDMNINQLAIHHWGPIKKRWSRGFSIPFVNNHMHIIMCGRLSDVYEDVQEDNKPGAKWKPVKVGTKMATEKEMGYEPSLLIEMERELHNDGGSFNRVATILKDRSFRLDGATMTFTMPKKGGKADIDGLIKINQPFNFIKPHVEVLNLGADTEGITKKTQGKIFDRDGNDSWHREQNEKQLLLGNIGTILAKHWPGSDVASKKAKGDMVESMTWAVYGKPVRNWEFVEQKFDLQTVKRLYVLAELMTNDSNRKMVEEKLQLGVGAKGKVDDPQAAVAGLYELAKSLDLGRGPGGENDLPF